MNTTHAEKTHAARALRVAMLSIHSDPTERLGLRYNGGMSVYLRELSRALGAWGHHVDIFTRDARPYPPDAPARGWRVVAICPNVRIVYLHVDGAESATRAALYERADAFAAQMMLFCAENGVDYELVHSNYWVSGAVGRRFSAQHPSRPCHLIAFHTLSATKAAVMRDLVVEPHRFAEEVRLVAECDGVIAPTETERARVIHHYNGVPETIRIVPCGVNVTQFTPAPAPERSGPQRLLYVGRFDPMKGIDRLLASVALLRASTDVELVMVGGDGPDSPEARSVLKQARAMGVADHVHLLGAIHHRELPRHYNAADAVVIASRYESFGLVILESLACGTPVASTRVGVAAHVIQQGVNGALAESGAPHHLAEAIQRALQVSRTQQRADISAAVAGFAWPCVAMQLLDVYTSTLTWASRPTPRRESTCVM